VGSDAGALLQGHPGAPGQSAAASPLDIKAAPHACGFSQDQDFAELADEVRAIAREQQRWLKIASAYPRIR
jgi:hypothetical protein